MKNLAFLLLGILISIISLDPVNLRAITVQTVTKEYLNFEVLEIRIDSQKIIINGWAFINETQHFVSSADHAIKLEFVSIDDTFMVDTTLTNLSMTASYKQMGLNFCFDGVYNSLECNYYYEYVGFTVTIPITKFLKGNKYTTNIVVYANLSQKFYKTPLYFPISTTPRIMVGDYRYSVISKLNDTSFKIIETPVYARKSPNRTGTIWQYGIDCSTTYTNRLYFKMYSTYNNILERQITDNQTYYLIKAKNDVCEDMRRRIVEGTVLSPVWISGMFVEYSGAPMEISSVLVNTSPVITANDQEITKGSILNLLDYAKCYDLEEGDLSSKIIVESSNMQDLVGIYQVVYYVEDKYSYSNRKTINITVIDEYNDPPVIEAVDIRVLQYSIFDYFNGISAYDLQDGDITNKLEILNQINTSNLGDQNLCYQVMDSKEAITTKCIVINVFSELSQVSKYRFVSKKNLFINDMIPILWTNRVVDIEYLLNKIDSIQIYNFP